MISITVKTSRDYEVTVGAGAVRRLPEFIGKEFPKARKAALIVDANVDALHSDRVSALLEGGKVQLSKFVFPARERSKNIGTYARILEFLAERRFSRRDIVLALGGGVTGDLAGFAAATYMRGIDFIQIPTSLLAMVDSSVGGKTGIDLAAGKNLAGAFHQPRSVFCDTDFLATLPDEWRTDGMGEVFKYAVLADAELFARLEKDAQGLIGSDQIARCIRLKRDIVNMDEREAGPRKLLNLGHTFAHAIEYLSAYGISHGRAVATGIVMAARVACRDGMIEESEVERIEKLALAMGYETTCRFAPEEMAEVMLSDKKAAAGSVDFVLPQAIGRCVVKSVAAENLAAMVRGAR